PTHRDGGIDAVAADAPRRPVRCGGGPPCSSDVECCVTDDGAQHFGEACVDAGTCPTAVISCTGRLDCAPGRVCCPFSRARPRLDHVSCVQSCPVDEPDVYGLRDAWVLCDPQDGDLCPDGGSCSAITAPNLEAPRLVACH